MLGHRVFGWARRTPYLADLPRDVAVLSFVAFAVALGYGIAAPALPVYARTFGVSAFVASTVISGFALMRLLSAGPAGLAVDRFGERRIMSIGIWVVAGSSLMTALAQSFGQLLVLRGVGGIGSSMFTVSAMALLLRTAGPEQRGRASGAFQAGFLFGGVTGPAIGGAVTAISIRAPFVVYGITLVVAGLLAAKYLSREPADGPAPSPAPAPTVEGPAGDGGGGDGDHGPDPTRAAPASLGSALRSAAYRAALMVNLSSGFIVFGLRISLVPLFVTEGLEQGVGLVGIGFLCAAASQAVMLIPAGRWTDTSGRRGSMLVGAATLTVSMLLLALGTGAAGFLLAMAASGLASAFLAPASSAVVGDLTRGLSGGRVVSAYQMVGDLGGILGPLIAGALADAAGFQWAFTAGVVIGLVTMAFVAVMPETLRREPEDSPTRAA
ncbi:MAG: MFS transporter [Candidatus Nanopelagicales bacterium]|nr:MFS transporter [Candidatus Nanopelagicales bacterium]